MPKRPVSLLFGKIKYYKNCIDQTAAVRFIILYIGNKCRINVGRDTVIREFCSVLMIYFLH